MIKRTYNKMKEVSTIYIVSVVVLLFILSLFFVLMPKIQASSGDNVYGYAWSDSIGWISFNNCTNPAPTSCTGVNYGVKYETPSSDSAYLTGYAWSSNIGWIQFGGLTDFPNVSANGGTEQDNAKIIKEDGFLKLKGWARAVAPLGFSSSNCPTKDNGNNGCWDGWISLSGKDLSGGYYGVKFNLGGNSVTPSFAWGSNVVGWIDFSETIIDSTLFNPPLVSISLEADPLCVPDSNPYTLLTWGTEGLNNCDIDNYSVDSNGTLSKEVVSPSHTFVLTCKETANPTNTRSDSVEVFRKTICNPTSTNKKPMYIER